MSEILITNELVKQASVSQSISSQVVQQLLDQFTDSFRLGQTVKAQVLLVEGKVIGGKTNNQYWLIIDDYKIALPKETIEQWGLKDKQIITLRITALSPAIELQIKRSKSAIDVIKPNLPNTLSNNLSNNLSNTVSKPSPEVNNLLDSSTNQQATVKSLVSNAPANTVNQILAQIQGKPLPTHSQQPTTQQMAHKQTTMSSSTSPLAKSVEQTVSAQASKSESTKLLSEIKVFLNTSKKTPALINVNSDNTQFKNEKINLTTQDNTNIKSNSLSNETKLARETQPSRALSSNHTKLSVPLEILNKNLPSSIENKPLTINTAMPNNKTSVALSVTVPKEADTVNTKNTTAPEIKLAQNQKAQLPKFEIPISLPDKERFPLLFENITTAFNRHLQQQKPQVNNFNNLLSQLARLNQWTREHKSSRRTSQGAQYDKMAGDLKQSIKDMLRYTANKSSVQTAKGVAKAILQSGTFLENKTHKQRLVEKNESSRIKPELTLHKDLKANLNRILALSLYHSAKLKTSLGNQSTAANSAQASDTLVKSQTTTSNNKNLQSSVAQRQIEAKGLMATNNLLNNVRNNLMKLSSAKPSASNLIELEIITKEILKNTQTALSRTQLTQLSNLRPDNATQQWFFELPVVNEKQIDIFSMLLQQQSKDAEKKKSAKNSAWSIVLQFDIAQLGKIRAMLTWANNSVQVRFIAEQENTASLVDTELIHFQQQLTNKNIAFEELTVEQAGLNELSFQFSEGKDNV